MGFDFGDVAGGGDEVVGQAGGQGVGVGVVAHLFEQGDGDALYGGALDLAGGLHLVEELAAVGDGDVADQIYFAGFGVYLHDGDMGAAGEGGLALVESGFDLGSG